MRERVPTFLLLVPGPWSTPQTVLDALRDAGVRAETVRLLGAECPTGPVIAAISVLLEDPAPGVKSQVQKTLKQIGPANVSVELVSELQQEFTT